MDITTEEYLFHDIGGIGFGESTDFRSIGPVWRLTSANYSQEPVTGKMLFSEIGIQTPYQKYQMFKTFIDKPPLTLIYYPHGPSTTPYYKTVRVTSLAKGEINEYGVLDCDIEFMPYTPWYEIKVEENASREEEPNSGWIWDVGTTWRDVIVPVEPEVHLYKFGGETRYGITFECESNANGLTKLIIKGPATNPTWYHYVNGQLASSGGFDPENTVRLTEDESLIVDNTEGTYSMYIRNDITYITRNVYSLRDFDKKCFIKLSEGVNSITVTTADGSQLGLSVEGHLFYATV